VEKIFFFGHGGWDPRGQKTGFTMVPAGTRFSFYTGVNTLMTLKFGYDLIEGSAGAAADQEYEQFQSCPNMTLYPAPEFHSDIQAAMAGSGARVIVVNGEMKLSKLFLEYSGHDIVWIACRALELKNAGGSGFGINRVGR